MFSGSNPSIHLERKILLPFLVIECLESSVTEPLSKQPSKSAFRAVVVAQLAERLLLTPEICSSTPVIGYFYRALLNVNCVENKEKEAGNGPLKTF